jgi:acetyl esterase/lipase
MVHGGCWTKGFATLSYLSPLAADLAAHGVATWNIEYRQIGDAGAGWPGSFLDWAAGTDHLRDLTKTYPLDLGRVVVIGHSAGAPAAFWLASRYRLPADSPIVGGEAPLAIKAAIAIDGPGDLAGDLLTREVAICGAPVVETFMGGSPGSAPGRYAQGNPAALLPIQARETLVSSVVLTPKEAGDYQVAAAAKGLKVDIIALKDAGHFDMLSPVTPSGAQLERAILQATGIGPAPP